jgi:hypothetical protein
MPKLHVFCWSRASNVYAITISFGRVVVKVVVQRLVEELQNAEPVPSSASGLVEIVKSKKLTVVCPLT